MGGYQELEPIGPDYQFNAECEGEEVKDVAQDADMEEKVDGYITAQRRQRERQA